MTADIVWSGAARPSGSWLVLDVDDTLVATFRTGFAKCREVARRLRLRPPSEEVFAEFYGRMTFTECVRSLHPEVDVARYQALYDDLASAYPPEPLCDGRALRDAVATAGLRCGVLTNGPGAKTARKLRACGLDPDAMDFVVDADTATTRKPHVDAFTALRAYGVEAGLAWYVTDSAAEWAGAEAAGFRTVGVVTGRSIGRGRLPVLLTDAGRLPDVVPILSASASSPRPDPSDAVTFDAGFTLIRPIREPTQVIRAELARSGAVPAAAEVRAALAGAAGALESPESWWASPATADRTLRRFYEEALADLGCGSRVTAGDVLDAYVAATNWQAVPGAHDLLAAARAAGLRVGVLSNWQPSLGVVLAEAGLARYVDVVIPSTLAGAAKPSPEAFLAAADALGVPPRRMVHVGDQVVDDIFGALRAGCRAILPGDSLTDLTSHFASDV
jgi:HAD superfamily hydrolase (TIGR01549 family)